jgi:hypothetical protein
MRCALLLFVDNRPSTRRAAGRGAGRHVGRRRLDVGVVLVEWTFVRIVGQGLVRKTTNAAASDRTVMLPA